MGDYGPLLQSGAPHPEAWSAECKRCVWPYRTVLTGRVRYMAGRLVNRATPRAQGDAYAWCEQCQHTFPPIRRDRKVKARPEGLVP